MKQTEIKIGGHYEALVNNRLSVVRVDSIEENYNGRKRYEVTNLSTGRKTTFKAATKFRKESNRPPSKNGDTFLGESECKAPHVIVEARAGTGKTTTLVEGVRVLLGEAPRIVPSEEQQRVWDLLSQSSEVRSVAFCSFNKSIEQELSRRVPAGCDTMTFHGLGCRAVRGAFHGLREPNKYRVSDIVFKIINGRKIDVRESKLWRHENVTMLSIIDEVVGLLKMNLMDGTKDDIDEIISMYDIEVNGSRHEVYELVPEVLKQCKLVGLDMQIDFNDMVWLPVVLNLRLPKYDLLLVDESQDLNRCQQELLKRVGKRLVFVGDPRQAIYGFAGADGRSMTRLLEDLQSTNQGCEKTYLTVTRRCGREIVRKANTIVPDFYAHEDNPEGEVRYSNYPYTIDKEGNKVDQPEPHYYRELQDGDMVLCRVNAPLVRECFRMLKLNRRAYIQGRDVGAGLLNTIEKMVKAGANTIDELKMKLCQWVENEVAKEQGKKNPNEKRVINLQDKEECILLFCDQVDSIEALRQKIEEIFKDKDIKGIRFSTIHKAKGLEANRVFFLQIAKAKCPHPMAKSILAQEQEQNLLYVAYTRSIRELIIVT